MPQPNDLSRSLVALDQPGIERQPCKKLEPSPERLLAVLHRWQDEAVRAGRTITRIALAFEAGRDGFWLARWLEVIAAKLTAVRKGKIRRLIINLPPRHLKSLLASIAFPA
jgi:hypothetical protein